MKSVDHLMWVCQNLAQGIAEIYELTGVLPQFSGAHEGMGTHNALMSLGSDCYLEILAPDPQQSIDSPFVTHLKHIKKSGLLAWAARVHDLTQVDPKLADDRLLALKPIDAQRRTETGELLRWQLRFMGATEFGYPFLIDWLDCVHPAETSPKGAVINSLIIHSPDEVRLQHGFKCLGLDVSIQSAAQFNMTAALESPKGSVLLESCEPNFGLIASA